MGNLLGELAWFWRDRAGLRRLRIHRLQILYFTYLAHAALGLPSREIRERRTFLLTPLFLHLLAIGDLLMERYGRLFPLPELERRLDAARRQCSPFWFSAEEILSRGADRDRLHTLARDCRFPVVGDPCRLIMEASDAIGDIIRAQPIGARPKRRALREFTLAYNTVLGSAICERRLLDDLGPFPEPDEVCRVLQAKGSDFAAHWLDCLLLASGRGPEEYRPVKAQLCSFVHVAVLDDEVRDVAPDYGRQPNVVLSTARHRFPSEFAALERALEQGETFRTVGGSSRLKAVMPETMACLAQMRASARARLRAAPLFGWMLLLQKALIGAKSVQDSLSSWRSPAGKPGERWDRVPRGR
jgi:hypothetical protein